MNAGALKQEMETELHRILEFWSTQCKDTHRGGFVGEMDNENHVNPNAGKGSILNARILWSFSAAYRLTGRSIYLDDAKRAFAYFRDHFVDPEFGGVFWELNPSGEVLNDRKQVYAVAFALYGLSEFYRASGEKEALDLALDMYRCLEKHSFDRDRNGYWEAFTREWGHMEDVRLSDKDENAPKTMNTHLHVLEAYTNLYRVWEDEALALQIRNLIEVFLNKILQSNHHFGLFFDPDWIPSSENISYGHDIEGSWLIYEAAEVLGDESFLKDVAQRMTKMAKATALEGMTEDGAIKEELDVASGHQDSTRHWWPQAEGIVGFVNAYQLTSDDRFLQLAVRVWEYTRAHLLDLKHGEWFWRVTPEGNPVADACKVGFWKCPYHNSRACMEIMQRL